MEDVSKAEEKYVRQRLSMQRQKISKISMTTDESIWHQRSMLSRIAIYIYTSPFTMNTEVV